MITRKLLRDWKHYCKLTQRDTNTHLSRNRFWLRPQDTNIHIWNLLVYDRITNSEVFALLYVNNDCEVLVRCLTPLVGRHCFPLNRTVSFAHLSGMLKHEEHGFLKLVSQISDYITANICSHSDLHRLTVAWNRIIYREFKHLFPDCIGSLQQGDLEWVRSVKHMYYRNLKLDLRLIGQEMESQGNSGVTECQSSTTNLTELEHAPLKIITNSSFKRHSPSSFEDANNAFCKKRKR